VFLDYRDSALENGGIPARSVRAELRIGFSDLEVVPLGTVGLCLDYVLSSTRCDGDRSRLQTTRGGLGPLAFSLRSVLASVLVSRSLCRS